LDADARLIKSAFGSITPFSVRDEGTEGRGYGSTIEVDKRTDQAAETLSSARMKTADWCSETWQLD